MSYFLLYTYGHKVVPKKLLSIGTCPQCGQYTEQYLSRSSFRIGLFYVPLIFIPTGHYINCASCEAGTKISLSEYRRLKKENPDMPSVRYMSRAFAIIRELVDAAAPEDRTVENIYSLLEKKLRIEKGEQHIRQVIADYLAYLSSIAAAQTAAAVPAAEGTAAAKAAPAGEVLLQEFPEGQTPAVPAGYVPPVLKEVPNVYAGYTQSVKKPLSPKILWLLPAILMTLVALVFIIACISVFSEPLSSSGTDAFFEVMGRIIASLIFVGIPTGLSVLFYWLAFRKKKTK